MTPTQNATECAFDPKALGKDGNWLTFILFSQAAFQYLYTGCELGLFDLLAKAPGMTSGEIQRELGLEVHPLRGLLFGLSSLGLVVARDGGYHNNDSVRDMIESQGWDVFKDTARFHGEIVYPGERDLKESIRTNSNVGLRQFPGQGRDLYHRLAENPDLQDVFYQYMGSWSRHALPLLLRSADLGHNRRVLDVGGGDASNAIALAQKYPHIQITLMDLPLNSHVPRERIRSVGMEARIRVLEADMFGGPFPEGHDCIVFAHQLVIWAEATNRELLSRAYQALPEGGKVVIASSIADDTEDGPVMTAMDTAYFLSIPVAGGFIYPWKDYERWLTAAGFRRFERFQGEGWTPHGVLVAYK